MKIGAVEIDTTRNVEISFEKSFEVAKDNIERMPVAQKKTAGIVSRFIAVERNLKRTDMALGKDLNIGKVKQIAISDDKGFVFAGMTFGKLAKRIGKRLNKVDSKQRFAAKPSDL